MSSDTSNKFLMVLVNYNNPEFKSKFEQFLPVYVTKHLIEEIPLAFHRPHFKIHKNSPCEKGLSSTFPWATEESI